MKMRNSIYLIMFMILFGIVSCENYSNKDKSNRKVAKETNDAKSLKKIFGKNFHVGAALNSEQIFGEDTLGVQIIDNHFNSIVAENCMKSEVLQPQEGVFDFKQADAFVDRGEKAGMFIIGHTLIWHSQAPPWFFIDKEGNDVSREVMIERMRKHISTVVGRYKGRIHGWDVVNEAVEDDGSYRKSKFYEIIGKDYIKLAFQFAKEADPDAELYYNDYSMHLKNKREGVVEMVQGLKDEGVAVDGIGMQAHCGLKYPLLNEFEESIIAFSDLAVNVMVTELDISVLPMPDLSLGADVIKTLEYKEEYNPYVKELPDSIEHKFTERYVNFFKLFRKHQDKLSRVTFWGVHDEMSWKNNWPIKGRTDYPLLFGRDCREKNALKKIVGGAL